MGEVDSLLAATALFVGGHFLLSSQACREPLQRRLGEGGFRLFYSALTGIAFAWMLLAYGRRSGTPLWEVPQFLLWLPLLVMPFAFILLVSGLTSRSPTALGGEKELREGVGRAARGIVTVTRHPFLWGTTLWAVSHLLANPDAASLILMGGIALLSLGGMWHIDRRRERELGAAWGPFRLTTSGLPFAAALAGRSAIDWRGIGLWRPLLGLLLYLAFLHFHPQLIGVGALPF